MATTQTERLARNDVVVIVNPASSFYRQVGSVVAVDTGLTNIWCYVYILERGTLWDIWYKEEDLKKAPAKHLDICAGDVDGGHCACP
jgi:hypothetical protein